MEDGPRERLLALGAQSLGNSELLAVVLGTGTREENVISLASRVLQDAGDLGGLAQLGPGRLAQCRGMGRSKSARVMAAIELGRRASTAPIMRGQAFVGSRSVFDLLKGELHGLRQEHFIALAVDAKNRLLSRRTVAIGGLTSCGVTPSDVFRRLLLDGAAAAIFVHNHPSGDPTPSPEDIALTQRLGEAGLLLGLPMLDHVIFGDGNYVSFLDDGLIRHGTIRTPLATASEPGQGASPRPMPLSNIDAGQAS